MNAFSPISIMPTLEPNLPITPQVSKSNEMPEGVTKEEEDAFEDFEKMFVLMMLKEMRKSLNESSMTEKSHTTRIYEEMMDEAMADQMAASSQLGIAKELSHQLHADRLQHKMQVVEVALVRNDLEAIKV